MARMKRAISEYVITGIQTTLPFGTFVMNHPKFIEGDFNTHFIQEYFNPEALITPTNSDFEVLATAAVSFFQGNKTVNSETETPSEASDSNWFSQRRGLRNV
jgi:pyruvate carboxylase